jgi:hypothetical protein
MASNYYQQHLGTSSSYPLELTGPVNITNLTYVYPPIISTNSNFTSGTNTSTSFTFTIANQNYGNGTYLYSCQNQWSSTANLPWLVNGVFNAGQPGVLFTDFTTQAGSYNSSSPFNYIGGTTITATNNITYSGTYFQVQLPQSIYINGVYMAPATDGTNIYGFPSLMNVLGSTNGTTWSYIGQITGMIPVSGVNTLYPLSITPSYAYNYFRFVTTNLYGGYQAVIFRQLYITGIPLLIAVQMNSTQKIINGSGTIATSSILPQCYVGIGTTNPLCSLQVTGEVRIGSANSSNITHPLVICLNTDAAVLGNNSNLANICFKCNGTDNYAEILSTDLGLRGSINQPLRITGSPIEFNTYASGGATPMMTLTNSHTYGLGFVGIGTTNPLCSLQVTGKVRIGSANSSNVTDPLVLCLNTDTAVLGNNSNLANLRFRCSGTDNYAEIISNDLGLRGGINQPLRIIGSPIEFNTYAGGGVTPMMTLTNSNQYGLGYVGIGTTNPSVPLYVNGSASYSIGGNTGTVFGAYSTFSMGNNYSNSVSIACSNFICSWGVMAVSDRRIKTNIIQGDTSVALSKLLELPLMKYDYVDKIEYGDDNVYGLIAQDVKEILPECVTIVTKIIPSIYKLSTNITLSDDEANVIISVDIPETSEIKVDGIVELIIDGKENKYQTKVISFTSSQLVVKKWDNFDETKMVFVYGVEIHDFHTIDKAYLGLLCMGGVQELSKRNDALQQQVTTQQIIINTLQQQVSILMQQMASLLQK